MKVLVTGANGQVGSALVRLGAHSGFDVIGLDSSMLDISKPESIITALEKFKPDILVNAAAYTAVDRAESEASKANLVNGLAAGYLAKATAEHDIPLIHLSTDYVFNGEKAGAYTEDDPVSPLGVYGESKLFGEQLVQLHSKHFIILRTSWVFGIEGNNFPKTMLRLARERPEIGVVADQTGCPTFADDIAKVVFTMTDYYQKVGELPWGIFHYSGQLPSTWYDFAAHLLGEASKKGVIAITPHLKPLSTSQYPTAAKRPKNSILGCDKLVRAIPDIKLSDWAAGVDALLLTQ